MSCFLFYRIKHLIFDEADRKFTGLVWKSLTWIRTISNSTALPAAAQLILNRKAHI